MVLLLTVVVVVCFLASLLPLLFPGTVLAVLGVLLNGSLGAFLAGLAPGTQGTLFEDVAGGARLTFLGVLAVYVPALILLLWAQRGR